MCQDFSLVDVDPDMQRIDRPYGHQRIGEHAGLRVLAEPDIDFENRSIDRGLVQIDLGSIERSFRLIELCLRLAELGRQDLALPPPRLRSTAGD